MKELVTVLVISVGAIVGIIMLAQHATDDRFNDLRRQIHASDPRCDAWRTPQPQSGCTPFNIGNVGPFWKCCQP